ncbi:unnamed protein product [Closterium sp. NIES-65]|nr:unnamed protein product [Closterium sp. NIES-65]
MASASVSLLRRAARPILAGLYGGALSVAARQHLTSSCSSSAAAAGAAAAGLRNTMAGFHSSACPASDLSQSSGPSVTEETVSLVQASDKGIGLAFVEQLLKRQPTGRVIATCRDPMGAQHLDALHDQSGGRLDVMQLDVTKEDTIEAVAAAVRQKYGKLDLLLNVAGVLHRPNELQPESSLHWLCQDAMLLAYRVNAMGPMLVLKHMMPLLVTGGHTNPNRPYSIVANMSSRTGSISDNHIGGWYSYRASKAALNQFTKTAAVELAAQKSPVVAVLLHPGTVDTDLTRPFTAHLPADKIFTPDFAAEQLLGVIDGLSPSDNGRFIAILRPPRFPRFRCQRRPARAPMAALAVRAVSAAAAAALPAFPPSHMRASPAARETSLRIGGREKRGCSNGGWSCAGRRGRAVVALAAPPETVTAIVESGAATMVSAADWTSHLVLATLNTAATLASDGPIELPPAYLEDPWAIPEVSPLQSFASILLTGTIGVLLFRAIKRRASKVTESRFRSDSVEKLSSNPVVEERKRRAAEEAAEAAKRPPPTVLNTLGGALVAGSIAIVLYKFATSVDDVFAGQTLSTTYTVRNLSIAVRTIVSGLVWLATFIFALNSLGLTLYAFQLALGIDSPKDSPVSGSGSEADTAGSKDSEAKEAEVPVGSEEKKPLGFGVQAQPELAPPAVSAPLAPAAPEPADPAGQPAVQSTDEVLLGRVAEIAAELSRQMQEEQALQQSQGAILDQQALLLPPSPPLSPLLVSPQQSPPFPPPVPPPVVPSPPFPPPPPLRPTSLISPQSQGEPGSLGTTAGADEVLIGRVAAIEEQLMLQLAGASEEEGKREAGGEELGKGKVQERETSPHLPATPTPSHPPPPSPPPSHPPPPSPPALEPLFTVTSLNRTIRRVDLNKTFLEYHHHFREGELKLQCSGEPCPNLGSCGPEFPNLRACYWPNLVDAEYLFPDQPINCPKVMDMSVEGGREVSDTRCTHKGDDLRLDMFLPQYYELRDVYLDGDGLVFNESVFFDRHSLQFSFEPGKAKVHHYDRLLSLMYPLGVAFYHVLIELFSFEPGKAKVHHYDRVVSLMYPLGIAFYHVLIELVPHLFVLSPLLRDNPSIPIAIASHQVKAFSSLLVPFLGIPATALNLAVIPNRHADVNLLIHVDVLYQWVPFLTSVPSLASGRSASGFLSSPVYQAWPVVALPVGSFPHQCTKPGQWSLCQWVPFLTSVPSLASGRSASGFLSSPVYQAWPVVALPVGSFPHQCTKPGQWSLCARHVGGAAPPHPAAPLSPSQPLPLLPFALSFHKLPFPTTQPVYQACGRSAPAMWGELRRRFLLPPAGLPLFRPGLVPRHNHTHFLPPTADSPATTTPTSADSSIPVRAGDISETDVPLWSDAQTARLPYSWRAVIAHRRGAMRHLAAFDSLVAEMKRVFPPQRVFVFEGDLPILQAKLLFNRAAVYVGLHGAGLSNMIFMPSNSSVFEIRPRDYPNPCYHHLTMATQQNYYLVFGNGTKDSELRYNMSEVVSVLRVIADQTKRRVSARSWEVEEIGPRAGVGRGGAWGCTMLGATAAHCATIRWLEDGGDEGDGCVEGEEERGEWKVLLHTRATMPAGVASCATAGHCATSGRLEGGGRREC